MTRPSPCSDGDQRGAATILTVAMMGVLLLVGAATAVVAGLVVAHRQAQAAADLAALAGASALVDRAGSTGRDACGVAAQVAAANGGVLRSCAVDGQDVVVEVVVTGPRWLGQDQDLVGRARAGPSP